jgi:endonuclease/exonuclease/phosphatase family metal-dependent hydrolase
MRGGHPGSGAAAQGHPRRDGPCEGGAPRQGRGGAGLRPPTSGGRLLSWNVAGRVGPNQDRQLAALEEQPFDVLCLQEVTPTTRSRWEDELSARGLHVAVSDWAAEPRGSRRLAVLIASRTPVMPLPPLDLPWAERHLAARTRIAGAAVEVHTLHAPISSKADLVKVRTLEALHAVLAEEGSGGAMPESSSDPPPRVRILAGDLNTPRYESREGEILTFARTRTGNLRPALGERHDRAELLLVQDLVGHGWRDAFRAVHGYSRRDRSWVPVRGPGHRLDHILVSPGLQPVACDYVHEWREQRLSDHSAMWAEVVGDRMNNVG